MKIFANFARSEGIGRDRSITFVGEKKEKEKKSYASFVET